MATRKKTKATSINFSPCADNPHEKPMPGRKAAKLLGISLKTLEYHARRGRIKRLYIPGARKTIGYLASDIYAILKGGAE